MYWAFFFARRYILLYQVVTDGLAIGGIAIAMPFDIAGKHDTITGKPRGPTPRTSE